MADLPRRGDVVWLTLDPQAGREQKGRRPALVLSPVSYNRLTGLVVICPITSRVKGYRFEVALPFALPIQGVILADQLKSVDWQSRESEFGCTVPDDILAEVMAKVATLLPLDLL